MNPFDWAVTLLGAFAGVRFIGIPLLFVLAWLLDRRQHPHSHLHHEDEHADGLTAPWNRVKK